MNSFKLKMRFPDGSEHVFRPTGRNDPLGDDFFDVSPDGWLQHCFSPETHTFPNGMVYYTADGTFARLVFGPDGDHDWSNNPWTLSLRDGTRVTGTDPNSPQRIYDRNNNYIEIREITYNSHSATEIIDQLGRHIIVEREASPGRDLVHAWRNNEQGQLTELIWTIVWVGAGHGGGYYGNSHDSITGTLSYPQGSPNGIGQIILPTQTGGLSYTFTYHNAQAPEWGWGELASMTMPSGAQVKYQYCTTGPDWLVPAGILHSYPCGKDLIYQREYDGTSTQATEHWSLDLTEFESVMTAPELGVTRERFGQTNVSNWNSGLVYKTELPDGTVIEREWRRNTPYGYGSTFLRANPYIKTEYASIKNASGALVKTAIKDYTYDKNGNILQTAEYDWVDYGSVSRNSNDHPFGIPPGAQLKRITTNTYYSPTPDAESTASDPDTYTQSTAPNLRSALDATEVRLNFSEALSRNEVIYDNPLTTGNVIQQRTWDSTKGEVTRPLTEANSISVSHQYDIFGNRTQTTVPRVSARSLLTVW